jgi:hypothetical protein
VDLKAITGWSMYAMNKSMYFTEVSAKMPVKFYGQEPFYVLAKSVPL